ncbi:hypothetical protein [Floridanema aerugineum]|uniref:Uncharacterized protein n=1 Tax=Floridaenema aerugineum BLCC-F46 TaxID=3153654 RepID=A0ABV4X301_9CYAN
MYQQQGNGKGYQHSQQRGYQQSLGQPFDRQQTTFQIQNAQVVDGQLRVSGVLDLFIPIDQGQQFGQQQQRGY